MPELNQKDLGRYAANLLNELSRTESAAAQVLCLTGDLGAGKTTFVKALAAELGIEDTVTSPTFVIEQVYDLARDQAFRRLIHIDAYRLESGEELKTLGWEEQRDDPGNLIVVEWAGQVREVMPEDAMWLQFEVVNETTRAVNIVESRK